jgi:hypothetical protein
VDIVVDTVDFFPQRGEGCIAVRHVPAKLEKSFGERLRRPCSIAERSPSKRRQYVVGRLDKCKENIDIEGGRP